MAKKEFHVRMEPFIEAFTDHIRGLSSDELAKMAYELFGVNPVLKFHEDDTIFSFSTTDPDHDLAFCEVESVFKSVSFSIPPEVIENQATPKVGM